MVRVRYQPTDESDSLGHRQQRKKCRKRKRRVQRAGFWLHSVYVAGSHILLATTMRRRHPHAAALASHVTTAGTLRGRHVRGRQCTHHSRHKEGQQKR